MEKKRLWMVIAGLVALNCLTVAFFLTKQGVFITAAVVSGEKILMQDLQEELKAQYGEAVLEDLIDAKVIELTAEKYDIQVSDGAVDREMARLRLVYGLSGDTLEEERWREKIKSQLLLEEIFTRDAMFSDKELKDYYNQNILTYSFPSLYHLSRIIVATEKEANQVVEELEKGSDFSVLAMERSIDESTAFRGGDIGYVTAEDQEEYSDALKKLKPGDCSKPIRTKDGYEILYLHEFIKELKYSYEEVKEDVRRHLALEKMEGIPSARALRDEVDIAWFYDD